MKSSFSIEGMNVNYVTSRIRGGDFPPPPNSFNSTPLTKSNIQYINVSCSTKDILDFMTEFPLTSLYLSNTMFVCRYVFNQSSLEQLDRFGGFILLATSLSKGGFRQ